MDREQGDGRAAAGARLGGRAMKAAFMTGVDMVEIRPAPEPLLDPEGALLRVEACGICGTDARTFFNGDPRAPAPWILGHEPVGTRAEVGPPPPPPPGSSKETRPSRRSRLPGGPGPHR